MAKGPRLTQQDKEKVRSLKESGLTVVEIKERIGRSAASIYKLLKEEPIKNDPAI